MRNSFLHIFTFLTLVIPGLFLNSCKSTVDDPLPNEATLKFTVVDNQEISITGASVYFFTSQEDYDNAIQQSDYSAAVNSLTTSGSYDLITLTGGVEYWVFISWFDPVNNVFFNNLSISGKVDKLQKGSVITAKFKIKKFQGELSFWSKGGNYLPIYINIGTLKDTLYTTIPLAPTSAGNINASNFTLEPKVYSYYAVAQNGCVWSGNINVQDGEFYPIEFELCQRARVTFVAPAYNAAHGPIDIVLDNNDPIGTLTGTGSFTCGAGSLGTGAGSFVSVFRESNTYTYKATSQDGLCTWTGTFTLSNDDCQVITLSGC